MGNAQSIEEAYRRHDAGDSAQALALLAEVLAGHPADVDVLFARGNLRRESGDMEGASADYQAVLAIDPFHAKAHNNFGVIEQARGALPQAQAHFEAALRGDAPFADAAFNLGTVLQAQDQWAQALPWLERAVAWRPDFVGPLLHMGQGLEVLGRLEEAAAAMRRAIAIDPAFAGTHNDLGLILAEMNRLDEAIAALEQAVTLAPENDEFRTNLGLMLMQVGKFERAWACYEHRWKSEGQWRPAYRYEPAQEWHGGALTGKRLRVWWEQGLGDTLCFARFLPRVAARFGPAAISFEVQPGLRELLAHSLPGVEIIEQGEAGSGFDVHVPLMSLPARCGVTAQELDMPPYLAPTPAAVARWQARLAQVPGPRVGICWGAGLWVTGAGLERRWRSVDPASFEQLFDVAGVSFISLQKGARAEHAQRWAEQPAFFDWTADIASFDDTAALMAGLDLVITVDTSVTHLAGALGKPTWVLLRHEGGNLWEAAAERSAWYPRLRVFRQKEQAVWGEVMQRTAQALRAWAASGGTA